MLRGGGKRGKKKLSGKKKKAQVSDHDDYVRGKGGLQMTWLLYFGGKKGVEGVI